ncbi:hypothetical protein PoB_003647800 [Plakobranchus ocellatus]|uniref:Uncharacterized protein n=1 Tax=Plakobranchus ocellatus TaxID=259542 RepID=A0AAV4ATU9_9GAST|nr:hypothetical protein PoB_003647800 [Plakobranchus ocellatus]
MLNAKGKKSGRRKYSIRCPLDRDESELIATAEPIPSPQKSKKRLEKREKRKNRHKVPDQSYPLTILIASHPDKNGDPSPLRSQSVGQRSNDHTKKEGGEKLDSVTNQQPLRLHLKK